MFYVIPDILNEAINKKLDAAIAACPGSEVGREHLRLQLLDYFNEHGVIPDFRIVSSESQLEQNRGQAGHDDKRPR